MVSAMPKEAMLAVATAISNYAIKAGHIDLTLKIAHELSSTWPPQHQEMVRRQDWEDTRGNLTHYRNLPENPNKQTVIILFGADSVTDASGLADFYTCTPELIWKQEMKQSFRSWIMHKLEQAGLSYLDRDISMLDRIVKPLLEKGQGDLTQIGEWLEGLNMQQASNARDVAKIMLNNLDFFGCPRISQLPFDKKNNRLSTILGKAADFYDYTYFLEAKNRGNAIKKISALKAAEEEGREHGVPFAEEDVRGPYENGLSFLEGLQNYIEHDDQAEKARLMRCDFFVIWTQILKYSDREKKEKKAPSTKTLYGSPLEVFLSAIWQTLGHVAKENKAQETLHIESIALAGITFKHDGNDGQGGQEDPRQGNETAQETAEKARLFLQRMIGGIDELFEQHPDIRLKDGTEVPVQSFIFREYEGKAMNFTSSKTARPNLEFAIHIKTTEESYTKKYKWALPDHHMYRLSVELITSAIEALSAREERHKLPAFHLQYYDELLQVSSEEEVRRVLQHAIRDARDSDQLMTNLLNGDWTDEQDDPLLTPLRRLAAAYEPFLKYAAEHGIFSALFDMNGGWQELRRRHEEAFDEVRKLDDIRSSLIAPMLIRAFLIVQKRLPSEGDDWHINEYEPNAVATILHPSVLEMLQAQVVYLFRCFNYAVNEGLKKKPGQKAFRSHIWQSYTDLSAIQYPLNGLLYNGDKSLTADVRGHELIHRIGRPSAHESAPLSTRLLIRYGEDEQQEAVNDSAMFRDSSESKLLLRLMLDYFDLHPHAQDGLSIAIYRNKDIQPIIAAVDSYLKKLASKKDNNRYVLTPERKRPYAISITLFTESNDDTDVQAWVEQWKESWEAGEDDRDSPYQKCTFSIAHRIVQTDDQNLQYFQKLVRGEFEADIMVLYDFLHNSSGSSGRTADDFEKVQAYDVTKHQLQFPILERVSCIVNNAAERHKRKRVLSNRQFSISARHANLLHTIRTTVQQPGSIVVGSVDYQPWQKLIDDLHEKSEWVVCVDPNVDDRLLREVSPGTDKEREIIGFGSGVGSHGENNYTISTQQHTLAHLRGRFEAAIQHFYGPATGWSVADCKTVTEGVLNLATQLSGLSLVRATGTGDNYIHEFLANVFSRKLLHTGDQKYMCETLVSLDAYRHWFDLSDNMSRPDLMWLRADLSEAGKFSVRIKLIECKLGTENSVHTSKARAQINNGLKVLTSTFAPAHSNAAMADNRPDRRYWWMQLHRLIASKAKVSRRNETSVLEALEHLADGDFEIAWEAAVLAFWTNNSDTVEKKAFWKTGINGDIPAFIYAIGGKKIRDLFCDSDTERLDWTKIGQEEAEIELSDDEEISLPPEEDIYADDDDDVEEHEEESAPEQEAEITPMPKPESYRIKERTDRAAESDEKNETTDQPGGNAPARSLGNTPVDEKEPSFNNGYDRILLGNTVPGRNPVYWEFMHPDLGNRHLLIFGASGQGKTYAIQAILNEMSKFRQNSLIIDYTNGFLPDNLEHRTNEILHPEQHVVRENPLPINPFLPQSYDKGGINLKETPNNIGSRIASIFDSVYNLGNQQYSVLHQAVMEGVESLGAGMSLDETMRIIESYMEDGQNRNYAQTLGNKLRPFVLDKPFASGEQGFDWGHILGDETSMCNIFQLVQMDRNASQLITEFILWDLYGYLQSKGSKKEPKVVVLDEVQNLDHRQDRPLEKYLREGRKFGVSVIMATQTMSNLKKDERDRMFNAGHKLFFKPADTEVREFAKIAALATRERPEDWIPKLQSLSKGECYSIGEVATSDGRKLVGRATKIRITAMEERDFNE